MTSYLVSLLQHRYRNYASQSRQQSKNAMPLLLAGAQRDDGDQRENGPLRPSTRPTKSSQVVPVEGLGD